jgi:endonuclease III
MTNKENLSEILKRLKKEYPHPQTALHFSDPFQLLVATILSAQATDVLVNKITENLFKKYKTVNDYAKVSLETLQKDVSSINFYKTKAKNIQASAKIIVENFGSNVPKTMEELVSLPGVARKTANIVLTNAFGINEGIAVDTHVKDLMALTPKEQWGNISHLLIFHGRNICQAKKPRHQECVLYNICPSRNI